MGDRTSAGPACWWPAGGRHLSSHQKDGQPGRAGQERFDRAKSWLGRQFPGLLSNLQWANQQSLSGQAHLAVSNKALRLDLEAQGLILIPQVS